MEGGGAFIHIVTSLTDVCWVVKKDAKRFISFSDRQTDRQIDRQTSVKTDSQTGIQTETSVTDRFSYKLDIKAAL